MSKKKFSNGGYTGKVSKESTAGIIHNSGCCCGFALDGKSALDEINHKSGGEIKTTIITINEDGTMSKIED